MCQPDIIYVRIQDIRPPISYSDPPTVDLAIYAERPKCAAVITESMSFVVNYPSCLLARYQRTRRVIEVGRLLPLDSVRLSANVPISQSARFERREEDGEGWA
jgi:hypothetical protein